MLLPLAPKQRLRLGLETAGSQVVPLAAGKLSLGAAKAARGAIRAAAECDDGSNSRTACTRR